MDLGEGLSFSVGDMVKSMVVGDVALKVDAVGRIPVRSGERNGSWRYDGVCPSAMFVFICSRRVYGQFGRLQRGNCRRPNLYMD